MDLQLSGKRVLVTGGTRGIGRAIVEAFLDEGAVVGFCARKPEEVAATQDALHDRGRVAGTAVDVADGDALAAWVEQSAEAFGGLDVVVANVSALAIPDTEENWEISLKVDVMHTVRLVRAALPHLERSDTASIIAISSVSGRESDFASGPVRHREDRHHRLHPWSRTATGRQAHSRQHGLAWQHLLRGRSLGEHRNRQPGPVRDGGGLNPTGHMGTPEEIAGPVVFLASPRARRVSGTNLIVDGALTRGIQL